MNDSTYSPIEQSNIEHIKTWWQRYGTLCLVVILLVSCASLAWQYWQRKQTAEFTQASARYEQLLMSLEAQKSEEIASRAQNLIEHYPKTDYAKLAAFFLAQQAVTAGQLQIAIDRLKWVTETSKTASIRQVARMRWARVLFAQQKYQEALTVLQTMDEAQYIAEIEAIKGDIYVAMGKIAEARLAYMQALKPLSKTAGLRSLVQMKLENLPMGVRP